MDMRDIFGGAAGRPNDSQDFWRLSEIVLELDATTERRETQEGADRMGEELDKHIDREAAMYLAIQRSMRICGVNNAFEAMLKWDQVSKLATMYLEGFLLGARFVERGGHRDPL